MSSADVPAVPGDPSHDLESGNRTEKSGTDEDTRNTTPKSDHLEENDIVSWDGPDDPAYPRNWTPGIKLIHVLLVSGFTLYA